jgi:hypothetical protein
MKRDGEEREGENGRDGEKKRELTLNSYPYCVWARLTQLQMLDGVPVC